MSTSTTLTTNSTSVAIVGGGAAGMIAAAFAAKSGARVTLYEKNSLLGRKILITGKGRCNVTNLCDTNEILAATPTNPRFLHSIIAKFSPQDLMEYFESLGVPLKVERGNRVFPVSDKAEDIVRALHTDMLAHGCQVIHAKVERILTKDERAIGVMIDGRLFYHDKVIVATGGLSYPLTGSTGDGFKFARSLGMQIIEPRGALVPLESKESWCAALQGLALKNVELKLFDNALGKTIFCEFGEMLFTHFGVSGPLVLSASSYMKEDTTGERYTISIDLKPALDRETLDRRLLGDFDKNKNKNFINALDDLLPQKMIPIFCELSGIDSRKKVNSITAAERAHLVELFKNLRVTISERRPIAEAIVTAGGLSVHEVNPRTMESKKVKNLYFVGEVLDIDCLTGGFNLQFAFASGVAAARDIISKNEATFTS